VPEKNRFEATSHKIKFFAAPYYGSLWRSADFLFGWGGGKFPKLHSQFRCLVFILQC